MASSGKDSSALRMGSVGSVVVGHVPVVCGWVWGLGFWVWGLGFRV